VEAYVNDFEALSNEGQLLVLTKNTGKVQSSYTVRISVCSLLLCHLANIGQCYLFQLSVASCTKAIGTVPAQTFTIEAGKTNMRSFKMFAYDFKGSSSSCTGQFIKVSEKNPVGSASR
jgi:hypothetical protein